MRKYKKLFAALIGLAALTAMRQYEITVPGMEAVVMELVVSALTAFGVYSVSNG